MWKKLAPLLVVLSVALNLGFLGVWCAPFIRAHRSGQDRHGQADTGGIWCPLHRQLNVSAAQWRQLEPQLTEFRRRSQTACQEVNRNRHKLLDLVASPQPDLQAIAAKQEDILAGQRQVQKLVIEHLLAEQQVLTSEQRAGLFDLLGRQGGQCADRGSPAALSGDRSEKEGGSLGIGTGCRH